LVAVAALLAKTLDSLSSVETGFKKGELLVVELAHGTDRYKERQQLVGFYDELQRRAAALPGVDAVGASYDPPLRSNWFQGFDVVGAPAAPPGKGPGGLFRTVTPGYFAAAGVRIAEGRAFTDADGTTRPLRDDDFMVVAPYNAQVLRLRTALPAGVRVGTVDKFQGQEAPVVFFSMATSSGDDVPRSLSFLFSRNRLNVAISRAQCLAILVCSPRLLEARCQSIEEMQLVNALCRLVEYAET